MILHKVLETLTRRSLVGDISPHWKSIEALIAKVNPIAITKWEDTSAGKMSTNEVLVTASKSSLRITLKHLSLHKLRLETLFVDFINLGTLEYVLIILLLTKL